MTSKRVRGVFFAVMVLGLLGSPAAAEPEPAATPFPVVTRVAVERHAKQISFSLKKRRVIRASLITAAVGIFAYQTWELVRWFISTNPETKDDASQQPPKKRGLLPSGISWTSVGKVGLKLGASILAGQMLHMLVGKYIVPDTLSWYVHVCAPYRKILLEIDAHVVGIEQARAKKTDRIGYHVQSIASAYCDLVAQLTQVIGYMCFRAGDLLPKKVDEASKLIDYLIGVVNECSQQLASLCAAGEHADPHNLARALDTLGISLDAGCLQFSRLEGSFWYDGGYARRISMPQPRPSACKGDAA